MELPLDNDPIEEHAIECLARTRITSFAADPSDLKPFGGGTTLRWSVAVPPNCGVRITLNGQPVAASGTQQAQPAVTTRYTLAARARQATRVLDSVVVHVDTTACVSGAVPESLIRSQIRRAVDVLDRADARFSQRSDPRIDVRSNGISVALRFKVAIDDFVDPKDDVDFSMGLRVRNGSAEPFFRSCALHPDAGRPAPDCDEARAPTMPISSMPPVLDRFEPYRVDEARDRDGRDLPSVESLFYRRAGEDGRTETVGLYRHGEQSRFLATPTSRPAGSTRRPQCPAAGARAAGAALWSASCPARAGRASRC